MTEQNHTGNAAQGSWRQIDTAPKDGSKIDLWITPPQGAIVGDGYGRASDCWFSDGKWWFYDESQYASDLANCRSEVWHVTHWMPRPTAPGSAQPPAAPVETEEYQRCMEMLKDTLEDRLERLITAHLDLLGRDLPRLSAGTVHEYVANYRFEMDGGGSYCPSVHEEAMLEDAIEGYIASLPQASPRVGEPAAWVNGDELDNLLDDRTTLVQGVQSGWRKTPLYRALPQEAPEIALRKKIEEIAADCENAAKITSKLKWSVDPERLFSAYERIASSLRAALVLSRPDGGGK